jgi:sulfoxide reductase heme-binding subunit YedZ
MKLRFTRLQVAAHIGSWLPAALLTWDYYHSNLTVDPIQALTQRTGKYALVLLVLSLACTPINYLFGFHHVLKIRRALGVYAFLYAATHLLIFIGLDYGFDWTQLKNIILKQPFALVGLAAFLILLPMAITSYKRWMKYLGKNWKRLHRLVYLAVVLVILHYAWSLKGDIFRLQGNIGQPILFGAIVLVLLALRLKPVHVIVDNIRLALSHRHSAVIRHRTGSVRHEMRSVNIADHESLVTDLESSPTTLP